MKNFLSFVFVLVILIVLASCVGKNNSGDSNADSNSLDSATVSTQTGKPDSFKPTIDTIYLFEVNDKMYQLVLTHEVPSATGDLTTTVRIVDDERLDTLYKKTFDFNSVGQIAQPALGHCWLDLFNSGGGSGYQGTIFNIRISDEVVLQPLTDFNELSYWKSNRTATEFIYAQALWYNTTTDGEDFESHFSEHHQAIYVCSIEQDSVVDVYLGKTKHKFEFHDNENPLMEFRKKEPEIANQIHWEDNE